MSGDATSSHPSRPPIDVSVVIPAFREVERLPATLARMTAYLRAEGLTETWEILVVDDGSPDGTAESAAAFAPLVRVIAYQPNRGKGYAVRQGVLASRGRRVLFSDADLSTPIEEWSKLAAKMPPGGISIGSRGIDEGLIGVKQPFYRRWMGKSFNLFVRVFAMGGIRDTQCGFKLFDGELARRLFSRAKIDRFAFDVEILFLAQRLGASIAEVPVVWNNSAASRVHVVRDSTRMLLDLIQIRWIHRRLEI